MAVNSVQVHQVLATLGYGDAIGNEVLGIQKVLRNAGYESRIYVQTADPRLEELTEDYRDLVEDSHADNILIHHFSIGSRASRVAFALPDRMILVYHNITPPHYFVGVNETLVKECFTGRRELKAYTERCDLALGDSAFNTAELTEMGFPRTGILPVVPNFSHLEVEPDTLLTKSFNDEHTNILFVGRLIPNKCIEDLVRFFHVYSTRHNPRSRLLLVGSHNGFSDYHGSITELVRTLGTQNVHFLGHVSNEELTSLYDVSDLFLSASEHEGFCVPLIEAFYKQIPVMAFNAGAVPTTMDGGGVLYEYKDPRHVASIINAVLSDAALQAEIVSSQNTALDRLSVNNFDHTLLGYVDQVRSTSRALPQQVAPDFWTQFDLFEELEELWQYRPSAFGALRKESRRCDT